MVMAIGQSIGTGDRHEAREIRMVFAVAVVGCGKMEETAEW